LPWLSECKTYPKCKKIPIQFPDLSLNLLHKIAFGFYDAGWRIVRPWLKFNHRLAEGYAQRTLKDPLAGIADLWIQAASVGESFLAIEILKAIQLEQPVHVLLTANTRQGVEILNRALPELMGAKHHIQATARFFPFDQPSLMSAAVAAVRPRLMVLLETEIWPGLLLALKTHRSKTIIINGRLTEKSLRRYLFWPAIWQRLRPDKVFAVSAADAERFGRLFNLNGVETMPNIKFDRLAPPKTVGPDTDPITSLLPAAAPFVILASVRRQEETPVRHIIREILGNRERAVIGLFPRHLHRVPFWQRILNQMGIQCFLRSAADSPVPAGSVILWDTFGELPIAYQYAASAFIGGSLAPLGGQNILEPLVNGVRPVTGPSWENFAWVGAEIIASGLLRVAADWKEAAAFLIQDIDSPINRQAVITAARQYIKERRGGTLKACRQITGALECD
jgi:3-deoxy-D-manno-octulosonic-acid transferase